MCKKNEKCFICGNSNLIEVIDLGIQALTGVFPKEKGQKVTEGPLKLVKCMGNENVCGLLQLQHAYSLDEMYGDNYGYRSGLNKSMVVHLDRIVEKIQRTIPLEKDDLVIDIGSNDSTLLQAYSQSNLLLVGIDPTGKKFKDYYPDHIHLIPDYFSAESVRKNFADKKAKVITSIAMFYDLESPMDFMRQVYDVLADDGIWVFEQSYMPTMLEMNAYDTICHEHLEYYGLKQIKWMTDRIGFKIINIELSSANGGSFLVKVAKSNAPYRENTRLVEKILREEKTKELDQIKPYEAFKKNIYNHREELKRFIKKIKLENKIILGYGASTKGNVILQFCNFTEHDIPCIAEVNPDKFGRFTPGTGIPIISEEEAKTRNPDYLMVLPWHFKENILEKERGYLKSGGKLVFPLPTIKVY